MDVCKRRPILSCACRKGRFLGKPVVIVHDEVWLPYRDQSGWIMTSLIYSIFLLIFLLLLANVRSINGLANNSVASDTAVQLESYLQLQQIRQALIAWSVSSANPGM